MEMKISIKEVAQVLRDWPLEHLLAAAVLALALALLVLAWKFKK